MYYINCGQIYFVLFLCDTYKKAGKEVSKQYDILFIEPILHQISIFLFL